MKHEQTRAAFPLSPMQQGMLFHSLAAPHSGVDIQQVRLTLPEAIDVPAFQRAWQQAAASHEMLRCSFHWHGKDEPTQQIEGEIAVPFRLEHWVGIPKDEQHSALDAWLAADRLREFDLRNAPLWRITFFELGEAEWQLVWTVHHLLVDAQGILIVLRDVFALYEAFKRGGELTLPPPPPFADHVEHLRQLENRGQAETFWRESLKGYSVPATISRCTAVEENANAGRAAQEITLSKKATARLNSFAATHELTLNTLVQAAWALLLARYSGTDDLVFGVVRNGRRSSIAGADSIAGLFINTVPMRVEVRPELQLLPWLKALRTSGIAIRPFEHTALTDIQTWSDLPAGASLFDSLVNFQSRSLDSVLAAQGSEWGHRRLRILGQPNYPVALDVCGGESLQLELVYDPGRFESALITQMLAYLETLLETMPTQTDATLGDLPLLTKAEEESLAQWNATEIAHCKDKCIHELFAEQAARTPSALAVADDSARVTYAELNQRANDIGARLLSLGVGPGVRVGVWMTRSIEMVAAQLGVLKAGGSYLPLDPAAPVGRINYMLGDSHAKVLLTQRTLRATNKFEVPGLKVICSDELLDSIPPSPSVHPSDLHGPAYVIYTSGSTGTPKGIEVEHANLINLVTWHQSTYEVSPADRATLLANPSFDASVWELWPHLTAGASVHIPNDETVHQPAKLAAWLRDREITLTFVPTPLAEALFDEEWSEPCGLRAVLTGGDKLNRPPPEAFPCPLYNHYGPTECTVVATSGLIAASAKGVPSIGRPISNTKVFILDEQFQPIPIGVPGELCIAGDGLASGYLNRPELTAEKFVVLKTGQRIYRTGDFARWLPAGELEFLGRRDRQVKIRGHRIELGEIEFLLTQHLLVREAAVLSVADKESCRLSAFIVPQPDASITADALREFLREKFSDYMVPTEFSFLEALPLTANGKRDYLALMRILPKKASPPAFAAPESEVEKRLSAIWSEVLEVEGVGRHDDFFALGGHSLRAARIVSRVEDTFQCEFPIRDLFEAPTVALMAERLEGILSSKKKLRMVIPQQLALDRGGSPEQRKALSFAQERLWFLEQLQPGVPFNNIPVAFRLEGRLDVPALGDALNEIVRRHDVFHTAFKGDAGQPYVQLQSPSSLQVPVLDLAEVPESERELKIHALCREEAKKQFELGASPLLRATLLRLADDLHWLLLTTHHLVCDGWSMAVLRRELGQFYNALVGKQPLPVTAPGITYADFTEQQHERLSAEVIEKALVFWKRQLAGVPAALDVPTDRPRPAVQTYRGATYQISLSPTVVNEVRQLSRREGVTVFMVLLAAFQTVLQRYSGQSDILIGTPTAGRSRVDTENLVGLLLNTVVLRGDLSGDPTFHELLQRTRKVSLDAFAHQELPFEKLAEAIQPDRDLSRSPLFQVMFALQNGPQRPLELTGLKVFEQHVHSGTAKFDLTLSLEERANAITGVVEYNADLFDESTVRRLVGHLEILLKGVVADPAKRISEFTLLADEERQQLADWNQTQADYPRDKCIHELFLEQVARTPEATALCCGDEELSYQALNERAERVAERLRGLSVGPGVRVAICIERSLDMMIGLLGILKAGGCYVPLDPNYPGERLAFLLENSQASVLLTQEWLQQRLQFSRPGCKVECIETLLEGRSELKIEAVDSSASAAGSSDVAYIIYTSGSTGKPKGVMVTHRNVVNFFTGMDRVLGTKPGVWLAVTSISFDISVLELFWTLTRGYKIVIQEEEGHKPLRSRPTAISSVPKMDFSLFYFASEARGRNEDQYRLVIEGAKFADQNGFSAVWTPERHFHPFGGIFPNPSVISAAVAMITQRIQIRAGSIVLPLHHAVRVAEEWSVVDNLSKGRAAISIASGWHANDFAIAPQNYSKRKAIMIQNMDLIQRLWRGEEVSLTGRDGEPALVRMFPKPIQPELPMWLTSSGNPETFQLAGELGGNLLTHLSGQDIDSLAAKIEKYRVARKKSGHNGGNGRVSLMLHTFVWKDAAKVREMVRQPLLNYLRTYRDLTDSAHALPTGLQNQSARNGELNHLLEEATDRYLENCGLFGTPESCLATVEKLRAVGVDEIACLIDFGIAADSVLESLVPLNELRERANRSHSPARRSTTSQTDGRWRTVADNIVHHGVTHLQCTPSLAGALSLVPESLEAMRQLGKLLLGGEALPVDLARRLRAELPGELFNLYGPTETTIWSAAQRIESVEGVVSIGGPMANTQIHILDSNLQPIPIGVSGEMFIGGEGVARGYLNRPELTAERFVADPFSSDPARRMYRTGDLARWRSDGTIEFLGRSDQQVKLRGHRIELGEIESILREHAAVTDCAITMVDNAGNQSLLACVVASEASAVTAGDLRRFLESKVPDYMIPANFVTVDKLPLTPNGKLDRKALPLQAGQRTETRTDFVAPQSQVEQSIARIWCDLLGVDRVGVNDNFFDLGGHSLLVVQAQAKLRTELGVSVPVVRLFQYPTVGRLAGFLGNRESHSRFQRVRERGRHQRAAFTRRNQMEVVA